METETLKKLKTAVINGDIPAIIQETMQLSLETGASDIHIEPRKNVVQIRLRIDGILNVIVEYPSNLHPGIVSKIKIMANLRIDESRVPQDGRITTFIRETEVDMRVSTLPTINGEKIVMRVVDKSKKIPKIEQLGIVGRNAKVFGKAIDEPNGIILTSGPTGSGKTTTLYSTMQILNQSEVNIMTFEDPIENQMEGLNQSQIRSDINYTFALGLRTALRQDPDIIMVGEIRDKETIDIAIEASLTGHLVLSTIHTNSAVETITRIMNMKVPDFLLTASTNLIIAQRLARRLCNKCKNSVPPSNDAKKRIQSAFEIFEGYEGFDTNLLNDPIFYEAKKDGCESCGGKGYKGRIGIYEIMEMTENMKKAILDGAPSFELQKIAQKDGMITLEQDGLIKALNGDTSLEEVYKLVKN
jgi:type IV pilus assembly protein PilB